MMDVYHVIMKRIRINHGLSVKAFAGLMDCSETTIRRYENGESFVHIKYREKLKFYFPKEYTTDALRDCRNDPEYEDPYKAYRTQYTSNEVDSNQIPIDENMTENQPIGLESEISTANDEEIADSEIGNMADTDEEIPEEASDSEDGNTAEIDEDISEEASDSEDRNTTEIDEGISEEAYDSEDGNTAEKDEDISEEAYDSEGENTAEIDEDISTENKVNHSAMDEAAENEDNNQYKNLSYIYSGHMPQIPMGIAAKCLLQLSDGKCELCGQPAPFINTDGTPCLEPYFILKPEHGGEPVLDNTVMLCPNCHKKLDVLNMQSDVDKLSLIAQAHILK